MLGAIPWDTIVSVYEFRNTKNYNFTLFQYNSSYTDDSIMTMAIACWLLKDKEHSYQGAGEYYGDVWKEVPMRYVPEYGARPVKRVINDLFVNDLTMKLLEKELDKERKILVTLDGEKLNFINT